MAFQVEYEGTPVYGRERVTASIEIGVLTISGYGETHDSARRNLLHHVKLHQADVAAAVAAVEASEPPKVEPIR